MNRAKTSQCAMGVLSIYLPCDCGKSCGIRSRACGFLLIPLLALLLTACAGGGGSGAAAGSAGGNALGVNVSVSPQAATVPTGGSAQFVATVENLSGAPVQWEVNHVPGGNGAMGT